MEHLTEFSTNLLQVEQLLSNFNKEKYNIILKIIQQISLLMRKNIKSLTGFRNISCCEIQKNIVDIKNIFVENKEDLEKNFKIEIKFSKSDDFNKIISLLKQLVKKINYKLRYYNNCISICQE